MADGRIKDLNREISDFSSGDFIVVDGNIGSSKMSKDSLLQRTAQNALAGNVAPVFDPTRTSDNPYKDRESVVYNGKLYIFIVSHYGAWRSDDVAEYDLASYDKSISSKIRSYESFKEVFVDGTITTSGAVGSVVDLTVNSSSSFKCAVVDCEEFDEFEFSGVGGSNPRLWCFIDKDNKIIKKSASDASFTVVSGLVAPPSSKKLVVNCAKSSYNSGEYYRESRILDKVENNNVKIRKQDAFISFKDSFVVGNIYTNGSVGSVVDLTVNDSSGWRCAVVDCSYLDSFMIKGEGGSNPRLWCFVDKDNKIISHATASLNPQDAITLVAPLLAKKIIVNATSSSYNSQGGVFDKSCYLSHVLSIALSNKDEINKMQSFRPDYDFALEPQDFSEDISDMDFSDGGVKRMIEQVYSKFDELVLDFPDLVTKTDAAELAEEEYPAYANGVGSSDPDYLETPAYKTYLYKISDVNAGAGNTTNFVKKKLFIVAGQHGREEAAPFNTYLFAKKLCDATEQAAFSILSNFDVYIIPCLNGYGMYHFQRTNANGVDVNRNYPTPNWTSGGDNTENYTGPSAGSEFETQVVMKCAEAVAPDIFIDHHNYDYGEMQFYTSTCDENTLKDVYNSLVNLSSLFIRNFPSYFGKKFRLLQNASSSDAPKNANPAKGNAKTWAYNSLGIPAFTVEVCKRINYVNGEYSSSAGDYSNDAWKVGYMTLSEQIMRYSLLCYN